MSGGGGSSGARRWVAPCFRGAVWHAAWLSSAINAALTPLASLISTTGGAELASACALHCARPCSGDLLHGLLLSPIKHADNTNTHALLPTSTLDGASAREPPHRYAPAGHEELHPSSCCRRLRVAPVGKRARKRASLAYGLPLAAARASGRRAGAVPPFCLLSAPSGGGASRWLVWLVKAGLMQCWCLEVEVNGGCRRGGCRCLLV